MANDRNTVQVTYIGQDRFFDPNLGLTANPGTTILVTQARAKQLLVVYPRLFKVRSTEPEEAKTKHPIGRPKKK